MERTIESKTGIPPSGPLVPIWHTLTVVDATHGLGTDALNGLDEREAALRFANEGPNSLPEGATTSVLGLFLSQFKSLVIWVLIAAGIISGILGKMVDAIAIFSIVLLNAVIWRVFTRVDKGYPSPRDGQSASIYDFSENRS